MKESDVSRADAPRPAIALSIAGTDPSGGAGIHADLKAFTARGVMGTTVITALVAQNTHGVSRVLDLPLDFVADQFASVFDDLPVDATKSGMLGTRALVEHVIEEHARRDFGFYTVDPVMVSTSGHHLLQPDALALVRSGIVPLADLITPNLPEAALLLGDDVPEARTLDEMREQAQELVRRGARAVLLKGGHATGGDEVLDVLVTATDAHVYRHARVHTANTHGTGCSLSAAITAEIARMRHQQPGLEPDHAALREAVGEALAWLARALASAAPWQFSLNPAGAHGPVDHQVDIRPVRSGHPTRLHGEPA